MEKYFLIHSFEDKLVLGSSDTFLGKVWSKKCQKCALWHVLDASVPISLSSSAYQKGLTG